ncbi:MAG TPA: hypothetical protein DHV12_06310, partial [Thermotogae bacterium]|nr:hypothetical protein [Thermotogota bacterium]
AFCSPHPCGSVIVFVSVRFCASQDLENGMRDKGRNDVQTTFKKMYNLTGSDDIEFRGDNESTASLVALSILLITLMLL